MGRAPCVLILEADARLRASYTDVLRRAAFTVLDVGTLNEAELHLSSECWISHAFDFLVLDLESPVAERLALVERAIALEPAPSVAVVSDFRNGAHAPVLTRLGAHFVTKPLEPNDLLELLEVLAERRLDFPVRYAREHGLSGRELETMCHELAGRSLEEAASRSDCTAATLRTYWRRIFRKTGMRSRREVASDVMLRWSQTLRCGGVAEQRQRRR